MSRCEAGHGRCLQPNICSRDSLFKACGGGSCTWESVVHFVYGKFIQSMNNEGEIVSEEGSLWNKLSPELQDRVLAFLPVLAFLKLRTVCKRWAALPSSQGFRNLCMLVSPHPAYLLVCRRAHTFCIAYDESLNKWYDLDLRFLDRLCLPHWKSPTGDVYHSIEAASGGLFFIWSHKSDGDPSLYSVCNPVTRTWRKLPSLPYYIVPLAVAMVTDRRTLAYKIFVAADSAPETFLSPMAMQAQTSICSNSRSFQVDSP